MKIIIAVTSFVILKLAFAEYPPDITKCLDLEDYNGFDSAKFLKGNWYVTHARYGSNSTVCREYKPRLRKNGTVLIVEDGYYSFGDSPRYYRVRCRGNKENEKGKISLKCKQQSRGRENKIIFYFQLGLTVVETDYDKFAVLYRCAVSLNTTIPFIEDNLLILHRKEGDEYSMVKTLLQNYGSSLEEFLARKDSECLPSPVKILKKGNV
uniref:Salivary lipocalin n=1 Tax=Panstrongylus lignarius TaxID=156445 RepID=A0A224XXX9_9HEMI